MEWGRVVTRRSTWPLAIADQLLLWPAKLRSGNPRIKVISKYLKHRGLSAIPIPPATNDYGELKALWNMQGAHNNALQRQKGAKPLAWVLESFLNKHETTFSCLALFF